jgi:predicted MPP superfamily phosphohydrolase
VKISIIVLCVFVSIGITAFGYYANNNPFVSKYAITVPKKSSELTNLKVVCVSDIHLKNTTSNNFIKKLSEEIIKLQPDILVIPGDVIESSSKISSVKQELFQSCFNRINPKYGIFLSLGNHDEIENAEFYKEINMTLLKDSLIEVANKFQVLGLKYRGNHEIRPIDSLLENSLDLPVILLDHAPYCLEKAIENKIDIQFSGHTHNGQIFPFNYISSAIFELDWGYKKIDDTHIFVTCGVQDGLLPLRQNASIPIRTGSYSEIIEVNVNFE